MPLLYIHNPRNIRTTNRAGIFRQFGITNRAANCMLTRGESCVDTELEAQCTLMFFILGFFGVVKVGG
jgi:hypothetical protein